MLPIEVLKPNSNSSKIIAIGELLVDFVPAKVGMLISDAGQVIKTASGSSGIFACAASQLKCDSAFIGKVGTDSLSCFVYKAIEEQGVDLSRVVKSDEGQIGLGFIEYLGEGKRNYQFYRQNSVGSKFSAEDIDEEYIKSAFALHYSGMLLELSDEMRSACMKAVEIAKANNVIVSFDPNIRKELIKSEDAIKRLKWAIENADVIAPTLEEAKYITGIENIDDILSTLHRMGPKLVALTRDKDGAIISLNGGEVVHAKGIEVDAIDPTGAGDTFAAALLCGLQKGYPLDELAHFANSAGTLATMKQGIIGIALPTLEMVLELMEKERVKEIKG